MGYMVLAIGDERGHLGSGLTLAEAFTRIMALAHCDYVFHRVEGVMHLTLHHLDGVPEEYADAPDDRARYYPDHRSWLVDDAMARADIMRKFVRAGFKGYVVIRDNHPTHLSRRDLARIEHAVP